MATGSPAAREEEELAARSGARTAAGPTRPGDSRVLEQVLALPRARLLVDGYNRAIGGELLAGIAGCILLALVHDIAIRLLERALTPWRRAREGSAA